MIIVAVVVAVLVLASAVIFVRKHNSDAAKAKVAAAAAVCVQALTPTLNSLSDLDAKLNVGMVEVDYTKAVQDAEVAFNRVDTNTLSPSCTQNVVPHISTALASYTDASSAWNACITDINTTSCGSVNTTLSTQLQDDWLTAGTNIKAAKVALHGSSTSTQA